jgi:hypothetical protein
MDEEAVRAHGSVVTVVAATIIVSPPSIGRSDDVARSYLATTIDAIARVVGGHEVARFRILAFARRAARFVSGSIAELSFGV